MDGATILIIGWLLLCAAIAKAPEQLAQIALTATWVSMILAGLWSVFGRGLFS